MAHFAKIENNKVVKVIVAEQDFVDTLDGEWVQTSYNTYSGGYRRGLTDEEREANRLEGTQADRRARGRKNFAGVGYIYHHVDDAFYPPKPYPSWTLNKTVGKWVAPTTRPGPEYEWNEDLLDWEIMS